MVPETSILSLQCCRSSPLPGSSQGGELPSALPSTDGGRHWQPGTAGLRVVQAGFVVTVTFPLLLSQ